IAWLKARRRRSRLEASHPAERIGGGWSEIASFATDLGAPLDPRSTRREAAGQLAETFGEAAGTTTALARRADAAVFGAAHPSDEEVAGFWADVDGSLAALRSTQGFWGRQKARFSPRSLLAEGRTAPFIRRIRALGARVLARRRPGPGA
ncbi:MAG: transglutaminase domain-containing protein, partial [Sinomonas sp.]|nr:transglutaminase domain-containing protein [Sinomonas sp.]